MEILLNRWRGTGNIFLGITGTMIYMTYIALLISSLTYVNLDYIIDISEVINIFSYSIPITMHIGKLGTAILCGLFAGLLFLLGESMGWGKWVGYIVSDDKDRVINYNDKEGTKFPFIHQTANFFSNEKEDYLEYCETALFFRGIYYWLPLFSFITYLGLLDIMTSLISLTILAIGFPLACHIGRRMSITYKSRFISLSRGWENQEIVYGAIQFCCITLTLLLSN